MQQGEFATAAPVEQSERIAELDVLRGFALLGVLIANFDGFAGGGMMATGAQLAALSTVPIDHIADFLVEWLVLNKANTLFATLFGLGFYIQISRNGDRPGFVRRYSRRLFWLLVFGWLNLTLLWVWDILNVYAVTGFLLLAVRRWSTRSLVMVGFVLAMLSSSVMEVLAEAAGITLMDWNPYSDAAVLERQAASIAGDYGALNALFWRYTWTEWFACGMFFFWIAYAGGRFMLGAAIGRSGIVDKITDNLALLRRIRNIALPLGLLVAFALTALNQWDDQLLGETGVTIADVLASPSALLLAAGYACMIAVAWNTASGRSLLGLLKPVGQMALTNYLAQGLLYALVMFGVGPGLALAGKVGSAQVLAICMAFFAFQALYSRWWLARFRFGPMEWLWRWLTYGGSAPAMRRVAPA
ncbi:MAG: DUF418 domain-containing protein [Erythrobacter sp.]